MLIVTLANDKKRKFDTATDDYSIEGGRLYVRWFRTKKISRFGSCRVPMLTIFAAGRWAEVEYE